MIERTVKMRCPQCAATAMIRAIFDDADDGTGLKGKCTKCDIWMETASITNGNHMLKSGYDYELDDPFMLKAKESKIVKLKPTKETVK